MTYYSSEWPDKPISWFTYYAYSAGVQSNILLVDIGSEVKTRKSLPQYISSA